MSHEARSTSGDRTVAAPLISVEELHARPDVTVLDVRYRTGGPPGRPEFEAGHVPGAAYVDLDTDSARRPPPGRRRRTAPAARAGRTSRRRCGAVGVSGDRPVVVYDDWAGRAAARAWWLLRFHGHPTCGCSTAAGRRGWRPVGPAESGPTDPRPGNFTARPGAMAVVELEDVAARARAARACRRRPWAGVVEQVAEADELGIPVATLRRGGASLRRHREREGGGEEQHRDLRRAAPSSAAPRWRGGRSQRLAGRVGAGRHGSPQCSWFKLLSISSEGWVTFEFISGARCAVIRLVISCTVLTLEVSRKPCSVVPMPGRQCR